MALIRVNQIEAVQRHTEAAIRMTFGGEDAIAVHAVAADAHRIMQDFYRGRGGTESYLRLGDWIAPGHTARFWRHFNAASEFLRSGEWNPDTVFELEEDANDFMIVFAARWYQMQGLGATRDMRIFATWYIACNPGILRADAMPEAALSEKMATMSAALRPLGRADRLRAGQMALAHPAGSAD